MTQTAVEWLKERISIGLTYEQKVLFEGIFEQAKEMEEEQMFNHISFGANLKKSMEEIVYDDIKKSLEELVKQGKLKNFTNYKSE
jgi:hypothetical protein